MRDFSAATLRKLAARGVTIMSIVGIPDFTKDMPFANATRGYSVNDNGTGRVLTFAQVLELAA